ncbi:mycofactocin biosynthesis glycosyltransferase MftF [Nocardia cyriacigeorgica]|uniref:mycofactocin biosynthesis glycosyltransferase MftF n=1 Tax=Nocardia cyriacigeorgica TaxID=135487 RepID=UPI002453BB37|nr:mycofactocin biosynthesis glycosyltransferase MftF [Nocardia cyriacigeorgica]
MTLRLCLDIGVRRFAAGRVLLGGSPTRLVRLQPSGVRLMDDWLAGKPVGDDPAERALARRMLNSGLMHPLPVPGRFTKTAVTLVIPVRNNRSGLNRLLEATADLPRRIVVDDGSDVPIAGADHRHTTPRGPGGARNSGCGGVTTPLIAFLDSDCVPEAGWLDAVLPLLDDPDVAAVAPRVRSFATGPVGNYEDSCSSLDMGPDPAAVRVNGRVRYLPAAALVVRRTVFQAIGGFDEALRFGEDVDLIWRLLSAGHMVRYQPQSVVFHEPRTTVGAWLRQRFDYGTSAAPLAQRHPAHLHCAYLTRAFALQCVLAASGHPLAAMVPSILTATRTARRLRSYQIPARDAAEIALNGQLGSLRQVADALRRVWWPLALVSRRGRRLLALAYALSAITGNAHRRGVAWPALRALDDLSYGLGVWAGCLRHRRVEPLIPSFHPFPGGHT